MFDELIGTPIDFSAYVMNHLKIDNLTQEILIGYAFNLLKGTCKSFVELKYHFKECYKAINDRLDWHNPKGREFPFDLSKLLPLTEDRGRQVVPADYFINNNLGYLKGGSSTSKYVTSTTRTKSAKYDNIEVIEDIVPTLWRAKVLVRSTNQPQTSELKKILIDKMETNELINRSDIQRNLYNALVKSYNTDKDILSTYGDVVTLKRGRDDQEKDEDPSAGSNRGTKRKKSSKDAEPLKGSKSKELKSSSSSKEMHHNQGNESGHIDDQPNNKAASKHDWFQKPDKPPTPDRAWNESKSVDFRPP
nr:hypothetical protein [Tanacetum cinerariifolium]